MRVGVLTSVEARHRYFARTLGKRLNVVAVGYEETGYTPAALEGFDLTPGERHIVEDYFQERAEQETAFFSHAAAFFLNEAGCAVRHIGPGRLNSDGTLAFLRGAGVDTICVFGTNLIKAPLLEAFAGRIINLHLGLSPYYRGTGTNFYPLLNDEPEYVGATVHLIDAGIDSGPIISHTRPRIVSGDRPHTIGCKAILAGIQQVIRAARALERGCLSVVPQWQPRGARLYLRRDYHPRQVVQLVRMVEEGLIERYVARQAFVENRVKLIEANE